MTESQRNVLAQQLLDQHWKQAEELIPVYENLASPSLLQMLRDNPVDCEVLVRKACAMVVEQCRANIRNRKSLQGE